MYNEYGEIKGRYNQRSIISRIEALFLDNVGKIITNGMIIAVAKDPTTGREPENWHQRLSELRTDYGYRILSQRDIPSLKVGEYVLEDDVKRERVNKRIYPTKECWQAVLGRAHNTCEWTEGGNVCGLRSGDIDPIGGGTVKLTPDHKRPHSLNERIDNSNPDDWQALCGRHQVMKKNYWDNNTGKLNIIPILQAISEQDKRKAYGFLKNYFGENE